MKIFACLDKNAHTPKGKFINQLVPIVVCLLLFVAFISLSSFFIQYLINPFSSKKIVFEFHFVDFAVGFFLYFVTAVDYALIIGRMQDSNPGSKSRFVMNVFTCLGCFVGVSTVLFLWGYAKEIPALIIPVLIFAGGVMVKLAYEGREYYEESKKIPLIVRKNLCSLLDKLHTTTHAVTFWIPELGSPKVRRLKLSTLAAWSFFLPFIIGLDDLVGYMGAMTIYNVFSLLIGIYLADIIIDILIFVSPSFTKKVVESALLSLLASIAFLYLAYKSFHEAILITHEAYGVSVKLLLGGGVLLFVLANLLKMGVERSKAKAG